jgi:hypothetical protein
VSDAAKSSNNAQDPDPLKVLPYSGWWPLLVGGAAGVLLRLVFFGQPGNPYAAMMASFIYLAPIVVGAVTVYAAERSRRRAWGYYLWAPFVANVLFVLGTLLIMVEGLICAVVIVPLFATLGSLGGLLMGAICRLTNWPRQTLYCLALLPLLIGGLENQWQAPEQLRTVEQSIVVRAPARRVWKEIHEARDIRPDEVDSAWFFRIGVPLPQAAVSAAGERTRTIRMGKHVHFDQVATEWDEPRYVRWRHRYADDSFPPYALDEHVVLGGHYFDISTTSYRMIERGAATELQVRMEYRLSTSFNWYADPVATMLLRNLQQVLLEFYRVRSETPAG